jgi:D-alanyl-D-alanine carboxypeptidase (penicillin-binding protein 5/6)
MKDKILIFIIVLLLSSIIYINFSHILFKKSNPIATSQSKIKGATSNQEEYSFIKKQLDIPEKNSNYFEPNHIWSKSHILLDARSSQILSKKNEHERMPIASTTKIMTAIIALENYQLDDIVTISEKSSSQIPYKIGLAIGEKITVRDLIYAILIRSGNDAAYALAEHMGYENFIQKMNKKTEYLGLKNTYFKDPAGLDDEGYSTPYDLAHITNYALKYELFKEIINTQEKTISSIDGAHTHSFENSNRLIMPNEELYYQYSTGGKTGFTYKAGRCMVNVSQKNNIILISVILNTFEDSIYASAKESKKLLEWGYYTHDWHNH